MLRFSFHTHTMKHILPSLYGWRMCPTCPDCCKGAEPCMNIYGSNATIMGGSLGRADAAIGAVEAQKSTRSTAFACVCFLANGTAVLNIRQNYRKNTK